MKDLASILILGIGITGFIGGGIAAFLFTPQLSTERSQWFKRSVLASFSTVSSLFLLFLSMGAVDLFNLQGKALWNSILVILEYFLLGGILLTLLNYARILILEKYTKMM